MEIIVDDIILKIISPVHAQAYYALVNSYRFRLTKYFPKTMNAVQNQAGALAHLEKLEADHLSRSVFPFGIFQKHQLIGWISIKNITWQIPKCELGYYMDSAFEGKGIITQAVKAITSYTFNELNMEKIFLRIGADNLASKKIAIKNGFLKEGVLRNEFKLGQGALIDIEYYGKLRKA